jgi:hypothetical protein
VVHLANYLGLLHRAEQELERAFREVAAAHGDEPDVAVLCLRFAGQSAGHADALAPFVDRYGEDRPEEPERLHSELFGGTREGGLGLLRDLHDLYLMATECEIVWTLVGQAAQGARDAELAAAVERCQGEVAIQLKWLRTRMKQAAPQALVVAD